MNVYEAIISNFALLFGTTWIGFTFGAFHGCWRKCLFNQKCYTNTNLFWQWLGFKIGYLELLVFGFIAWSFIWVVPITGLIFVLYYFKVGIPYGEKQYHKKYGGPPSESV